MMLLNILILTISAWIILVVNYKFIQPALKNRQRFKLYKLRDELSILAMKGILDEHSESYLTLIGIQNSAISVSSSFKVTDYLRFLLHLQRDKSLKKKLLSTMDNLSKSDNAEYCRIAKDSFDVMHTLMYRDTRILRYALFPVLVLLSSLLVLVRCTVPKEQINRKKHIIKEIDDNLDGFSNEFGKGCVA